MQLSGPLMAKGIEDTTFYQHVDYLASNEVGDNPDISHAMSIEAWHDRMTERGLTEMNGGSTHDTKRGEDARARLHALSAAPGAWTAFAKTVESVLPEGQQLPGDVYFWLLQSVVGAWPSRRIESNAGSEDLEVRLAAFAEKALREGKRYGSWAEPNAAVEAQCAEVVTAWLSSPAFTLAMEKFDKTVRSQAYLNAIRGLVLRCTAPGSPDVYQGAEYGDYSLVDPDNRRPVDYPARNLSLIASTQIPVWQLFDADDDAFEFDRAKQRLVHVLLGLRQNNKALWLQGAYVPIEVIGGQGRVLAYRRVFGDDQAVVLLSIRSDAREMWPMADRFKGMSICLPTFGRGVDVLSGVAVDFGDETSVADLLARGPAAVFVAAE